MEWGSWKVQGYVLCILKPVPVYPFYSLSKQQHIPHCLAPLLTKLSMWHPQWLRCQMKLLYWCFVQGTLYMVATVDQIYLHMYRKNGIVKHEKVQTK